MKSYREEIPFSLSVVPIDHTVTILEKYQSETAFAKFLPNLAALSFKFLIPSALNSLLYQKGHFATPACIRRWFVSLQGNGVIIAPKSHK